MLSFLESLVSLALLALLSVECSVDEGWWSEGATEGNWARAKASATALAAFVVISYSDLFDNHLSEEHPHHNSETRVSPCNVGQARKNGKKIFIVGPLLDEYLNHKYLLLGKHDLMNEMNNLNE